MWGEVGVACVNENRRKLLELISSSAIKRLCTIFQHVDRYFAATLVVDTYKWAVFLQKCKKMLNKYVYFSDICIWTSFAEVFVFYFSLCTEFSKIPENQSSHEVCFHFAVAFKICLKKLIEMAVLLVCFNKPSPNRIEVGTLGFAWFDKQLMLFSDDGNIVVKCNTSHKSSDMPE